jgi:DNA-directed RNA polymerase alpha subunit
MKEMCKHLLVDSRFSSWFTYQNDLCSPGYKDQLHKPLTVNSYLYKGLDPLLQRRVNDCELSQRTIHALIGRGVYTLGDLIQYSRFQISHIRNIGEKCMNEIEKMLYDCGLKLKG